MLSTTTTALSTSMPTASSRPIIVRMLRVTPAKYMKPSVITKQIGIASVTIIVDGQWRRKKNSTDDRQHQADAAGLGQLDQRRGDVVALVVDDLDLQVVQRRLLADRLDFGQGACWTLPPGSRCAP